MYRRQQRQEALQDFPFNYFIESFYFARNDPLHIPVTQSWTVHTLLVRVKNLVHYDHVLVCPRVTVHNQVRNTGHSDVSNDLRNIFKSRQAAGKYYVANGEPLMDRYLQRVDVAAVNPDEINR
jgi:hypothetical protein